MKKCLGKWLNRACLFDLAKTDLLSVFISLG
jgi:hypothetical protein